MPSILHATPETWAETTAQTIAKLLFAALSERGVASFVVPGGRSAAAVLPLLADMDLAWENVTVTLTDERWVEANHPDSNAGLVQKHLLGPTLAQFTPLKTAGAFPREGLTTASQKLRDIPRPFDVVFLGMGDDGHIASLFPGAAIKPGELQCADRPDHPRISMTPACLLDSRHIVLPVPGEQKRSVLSRAELTGPLSEFPVRHILHQNAVPVTLITG